MASHSACVSALSFENEVKNPALVCSFPLRSGMGFGNTVKHKNVFHILGNMGWEPAFSLFFAARIAFNWLL